MKRTYFHGTSADHLPAILKQGLRPDCDKVWNPSCNEVYLWSPDKLTESGDTEAEYANDYAREQAYSSAQMALTLAKSGQCIVLEVELDDSLVEDDTSCANMTGAVATLEPIKPRQIRRVWISPDLSLLRGYFIAQAMRMPEFPSFRFSDTEKQIAEAIGNAEIYFESSDFPLEEYVRPARSARVTP
jgi:hypothetical protein